jgi:hypothetical protein
MIPPLDEAIRSTIVATRLISSTRLTPVNDPAHRRPNDVRKLLPARRAGEGGWSLLRSWLSSRW